MIGIYKITNTKNGKSYIGQSANVEMRLQQHKRSLEKSAKSWYLQARKESDSIDDFTFEILQECKLEELDELEEYWVDYYNSYSNGYNQTKDGICISANTQFIYFSEQTVEDIANKKNRVSFPVILFHKALQVFTYSEFKLYIFLLEKINYGKNIIPLSPSELLNSIGFALQSYRDAKKGLERKGILVFNGDKTFEFRPFVVLNKEDSDYSKSLTLL